jgi:hypothetical protein
LLAIEADGVGRSDKYTKVYGHRREYCCRRWLRHQRPGRHQNQAKYEGEGDESFEVRQHREFDEPCESGSEAGAHREAHGAGMGLIGPRGEQDDAEGRKSNS